jgi:hypothetical protein
MPKSPTIFIYTHAKIQRFRKHNPKSNKRQLTRKEVKKMKTNPLPRAPTENKPLRNNTKHL